jgi:hypothetical protein
MQLSRSFEALAHQFEAPNVNAIVLMGSHARGDPGLFSDIDLVRFTDKDEHEKPFPKDGSYLINGYLVTVSSVNPTQVEEWFSRPEMAVNVISGLQSARSLIDRHGTFATIQARAQAFKWDAAMQEKADVWASQMMVGLIEEVHKGLEGLRSSDIGRLLNARFGCSWLLSRVMCVHCGVLLSGDNAFYQEVMSAVGTDSEWARLRRAAFGIQEDGKRPPSLREQVVAGLRLYVVTAELLGKALLPADELLVMQTVDLIRTTLGQPMPDKQWLFS